VLFVATVALFQREMMPVAEASRHRVRVLPKRDFGFGATTEGADPRRSSANEDGGRWVTGTWDLHVADEVIEFVEALGVGPPIRMSEIEADPTVLKPLHGHRLRFGRVVLRHST
jgi:hypothetical protein